MTTSFSKEKHEYLIDGKKATGITTIIGVLAKPNLYSWYARMSAGYISDAIEGKIKECSESEPSEEMLTLTDDESIAWLRQVIKDAPSAGNKKKEAAGEHGTDTHALVEQYINEMLEKNSGHPHLTASTMETAPIQKFVDWAVDNVDHFLFSERQMFNKEMFIAGTADFGAVMKDGKKLIGDFKTSSGVYGIDYFLQCAGYKILAESEGDEPYDGCVIVRLGKDNSFDVHYRYDNQTDKDAFMACLTLYRAQATFTRPTK